MKKLLAVTAVLLLLVSLGTALTLEKPNIYKHTQSESIIIHVSDASGDVKYSINGQDAQSCGCTDPVSVIAPQGENTLRVYDDEETVEFDFFVDTEPPEVMAREPKDQVFEREPLLDLGYIDTSDIDTDSVEVKVDGEVVEGNADQTGFNATLTDLSEATHNVTYNLSDVHRSDAPSIHTVNGSWNFTLPVEPVLSGTAPKNLTDSSTTVELEARDPAGIDTENSKVEISGPIEREIVLEEGNITVNDSSVKLAEELEGLEDGVYSVKASVEDNEGNTAEEEWNFTVDTTPPDISIVSHLEGDVVKGEEEFEVNVSDLTELQKVNISLGTEDRTTYTSNGLHTASVNTSELDDGETELVVEAEDSAGNTGSRTITLTVDNHAPEVEQSDLYPTPAVSGLVISATASDSATSISTIDYRVNGPENYTFDEGELESVSDSYSSKEERGREVLDLEDLGLPTDTYTVSVRAEDSAGHSSSWTASEVRVDNFLDTRLEIEDGELRQVIGTTSTFNVKVSNPGEVDELVKLSAGDSFETSVSPEEKRIQTGETKQFELEIRLSADDEYLGNNSLELTAEGLSSTETKTAELIVQPLPDRQEEIRKELQDLEERLEELNETRQEWSLTGDVEEQFQSTLETVIRAEQLIEDGRYARASEILDSAEEQYEEAETSVTGGVTRERVEGLVSTGVRLLALLAVLGLIYGGYRIIPAEGGYHQDRGYVHRPGGKHPVRLKLEDRWRNLKEDEQEEEEEITVERWEGYED